MMSFAGWNVAEQEKYFPVYYAGHVLAAQSAKVPSELDRLLDQSLRDVGVKTQWDRLYQLSRYIQKTLPLSFNQAGCLLGELRCWREIGEALPAPGLRYLSRVWNPDAKWILHQFSKRLEEMPLSHGTWQIGKRIGLQRSKIQKPALIACSGYCWAPSELNVDELTKGWLNLECLPELWPDKIDLAVDVEDELGWLFEKSSEHVQRAIDALHQALLFGDQPRSTFRRAIPGRRSGASQPTKPRPEYPTIVANALLLDEKFAWLVAASNIRMANKMIHENQGIQALRYADEALRLAQGSFFWSARGFVRLALKQFGPAIADFDIAMRTNSRNADAYRGRAAAHHGAGDLQRALMYCNSAMTLGLADGRLCELRGCICHDLSKFEVAIDNYNQARALLRSDYPSRIDDFILEAENGKPRSARAVIYELGIRQ
jgi:tetratricopeptide (TPR) repeat protein